MKTLKITIVLILLLQINIFAQNQLWLNAGYGRYLTNSENSLKVLENEELDYFVNFGIGYQRNVIFGIPISFEYNYFQNTQKDAIKSIWTDATGTHLGEITGDYKLINHTFDLDYFDSIDENITFGIGPSFVITNRILDIDLPMNTPLELYDKLASSGIGVNGFVDFSTPHSNGNEYFFFNTNLKLRYTHSIWFDEGLRKLDDYNQEFFTAQISIGLGYYFSD